MPVAPETTLSSADPNVVVRARRDTLAAEAEELARRSARLSGLRGLLFLVALGSLGYGLFRSLPTIGWPPRPDGAPDTAVTGPHVAPPSVEVTIRIAFAPATSNWM